MLKRYMNYLFWGEADKCGLTSLRMLNTIILTLLCFNGNVQEVRADANNYFLVSGTTSAPPTGAANLCKTYPWACSQNSTDTEINQRVLQAIDIVNRRINREVRYVTDLRQFKIDEHWALPTVRGGDCEDIALLKKRILLEMRLEAQSLLIATVLDRNRNGHAVLVVRTTSGDMVLDNATHNILPWAETGYVFLRMQDPKSPNRWVRIING